LTLSLKYDKIINMKKIKWHPPQLLILSRKADSEGESVLTVCKAAPFAGAGGPYAGNPGCVSFEVPSGCIACNLFETS
jgi:hypothetical protein